MCYSRTASEEKMAAERQAAFEKHQQTPMIRATPAQQNYSDPNDEIKALKAKARAEDLSDVLCPPAVEVQRRGSNSGGVTGERSRRA